MLLYRSGLFRPLWSLAYGGIAGEKLWCQVQLSRQESTSGDGESRERVEAGNEDD